MGGCWQCSVLELGAAEMLLLHPRPARSLSYLHPPSGPEGGSIPQGFMGKVCQKKEKKNIKPHLVLKRQWRLEELYISFQSEILVFFSISLLGVSGFLGHLLRRADFEIKVL